MYTERDFKKWAKYERVRRGGLYNMVAEASEASKAANLNLQDYTKMLKKYDYIKSAIEKKYGDVETYLEKVK